MKMERKPLIHEPQTRWFPYLDRFRCGNGCVLTSANIIEAVAPCISESRKQRFGNAVRNRSYSVCLVVEGLCDFGNVSAAFRSADALGVQSVHVVSSDANKRASRGKSSASELGQFSPIFVWLLRDFYLDLTEDNRKITPRDYLELALRPVQGGGRDIAAKNEVNDLKNSPGLGKRELRQASYQALQLL
ncbi:Guanylate-binding protein, N-terminal [Sesbania bispinosa]|nr:Guanylate-binding protein, N-terminal [Sesbania bispinosa]